MSTHKILRCAQDDRLVRFFADAQNDIGMVSSWTECTLLCHPERNAPFYVILSVTKWSRRIFTSTQRFFIPLCSIQNDKGCKILCWHSEWHTLWDNL